MTQMHPSCDGHRRMHPRLRIEPARDPVLCFMTVTQHFCASYLEARCKFLEAARQRGAALNSFFHPSRVGPTGEPLAVDVAVLGNDTAERVLMIVSATHGVEGYAGSGCQVHYLNNELTRSPSVKVVLVHAINPYGFAYNRRTNEDNIDLNRNFIDFATPPPINPQYSEYAKRFLPAGGALTDYERAAARLADEARLRGGYQFLKTALQPGQYAHPDGLYYGGTTASWSNTIFMQICRRHLSQARRGAVLDVHTGLGAHGVGELIFMRQDSAQKYAHHFTAPVSCAGGKTSVSAGVKGPLVNAACDEIAGEVAIGCALEFGTVPVEDNTSAMIFENWTHRWLTPAHPLHQQSSQRLKDTYYCDSTAWKQSVIDRFTEITHQLHDCLDCVAAG
jgi:predicted deacylase